MSIASPKNPINADNLEALHLHGFNLLPQFGPTRLIKLANYFDTFQAAFRASQSDFLRAGIEPEIASIFLERRNSFNFETEKQKLAAAGISLLTFRDELYPKLLLETPRFPVLLYYKGKLLTEELCLAVVGTRKLTHYGRTALPEILSPLIGRGLSIVSGLAYGVDALAHELAVSAGRRTIAVLGNGLDNQSLYPKDHQFLAQRILDAGGLLISEHPIGTPAFKQHFVARNRIISGLALGTLVVECDLKSGALITANYALEQNRSVFAIPGPIYAPESRGPNNLIKMGARLVTQAQDILSDLNLESALPDNALAKEFSTATPNEKLLLEFLANEPKNINELIKLSKLDVSAVTATLTFLEMKGLVKNLGGQQYVRTRGA